MPKQKEEGCGCWFLSLFSPVCPPPCEKKKAFFSWRRCSLPALEPGISKKCPFKPLLTFGLLWIEFLRRLFIPSASSFVVCAKAKDDLPPECDKLVKAIDLPLYSDCKVESKKSEPANDNSVLITTIRCMREELGVFLEQVGVVKQELSEVYLKGKAHAESTLEYLRDPCNTYPRIGAITGGALAGYMVALRKGRVKKLMFMGAGAGAVASVIYPQETKEYSVEAMAYMKRYVTIAYHFFNGVSRDLTGWELPSLPNGHHLSVSDSQQRESADTVPEPSHLLPPTASAVHLHLYPDEVKK